jgi:hypothetical protein
MKKEFSGKCIEFNKPTIFEEIGYVLADGGLINIPVEFSGSARLDDDAKVVFDIEWMFHPLLADRLSELGYTRMEN